MSPLGYATDRADLYHVTSGDVRKLTMIRRIFGIRGRTADFLQTLRHTNLNK